MRFVYIYSAAVTILLVCLSSLWFYYGDMEAANMQDLKNAKDLNSLINQFTPESGTDVIIKKPQQNPLETKVNRAHFCDVLDSNVKDTVVQVFADVVEFNWLEPYKTPNQVEAAGTGFFINSNWEFATNHHVVDQAVSITVQFPTSGKRRYEAEAITISPERDLALLRIKPSEVERVKEDLKIKNSAYLRFGNSDALRRAEKVMTLGYPLAQNGLKSTTGVISGRENIAGQYYIQISAPINQGNSGGPSLNKSGQVIGINTASIPGAQNVNYIIPVNEVKLFLEQTASLPDTGKTKLWLKPYLGVKFHCADDNLTEFLGNPKPGGIYVAKITPGTLLHKAGLKIGDMIYRINNIAIDGYGEMNVPWNKEEKISLVSYLARLKIGQKMDIEFYRNGTKKKISLTFNHCDRPAICQRYPGYEKIDYEVIGGMVVMDLTLNHILLLAGANPELVKYADSDTHVYPSVIVTKILLNSPASRNRCILPGTLISEVNGVKVKNLADFRKQVLNSVDSGYITIKSTQGVFAAISVNKIIDSEHALSQTYFYPLSQTFLSLQEKALLKSKR